MDALRSKCKVEATQEGIKAIYRGSEIFIPFSAITYFRAEEKYVMVHSVRRRPVMIDLSLRKLLSFYGELVFSAGRQNLVVSSRMKAMQNNENGQGELWLDGTDDCIVVSRRFRPSVRRFLNEKAKVKNESSAL